ncbi:ectonucleoside triphosphate diphosphohydrolase-like protein [Sarcoptes scabiei]|uniref:Ectonucleoside triphosphate diphosphohydrolase-like protein n=1 Tax=Sarcoptes scabiei TaxID=52283 RepID=A0A132AI17_SARSC|nr:ectonucleoside triphosphate diphosphohydrolase-like protein [Sarcoptes scabiei]
MAIQCFSITHQTQYSIGVDSGSTHSRVILFRWRADKLNNTGLIEEVRSCEVGTGISKFVGKKMNSVADRLIECIADLRKMINSKIEDVFVYLGATAGMRLLNMSEPNTAAKIMDRIQNEFDLFGLQTKQISIISGHEEGLFAWIAANYLSGSLIFDQTSSSSSRKKFAITSRRKYPFSSSALLGQSPTYGIVDMGGASVQIAYEVPKTNATLNRKDPSTDEHITKITLFNHNFSVESFSDLCFGTHQAMNRYLKVVIEDYLSTQSDLELNRLTSNFDSNGIIKVPCFPSDLRTSTFDYQIYDNLCTKQKIISKLPKKKTEFRLIGTSQTEQCQESIDRLLNINECRKKFEICFKEFDADKNHHLFYALSAYYHSTKRLNLSETASIEQLTNQTKMVCSMSKHQLLNDLQIPYRYIASLCFDLSYIIRTLTRLYKFNEETWSNLRFVDQINRTYVGWITGLMINATNTMPAEEPIQSLMKFSVYLSLIIILALFFIINCIIVILKSKSTEVSVY